MVAAGAPAAANGEADMRNAIAITLTLLLAGAAAAESCPGLIEVGSNGGKAWLGINAGGYVAGEGQSFVTPCGGKLNTVAFEVILDGQTWNSAPPLNESSVLICSIRIPGIMTLGTVMRTIGFSLGSEWVEFDFSSQGLDLDPGVTYLITCAPAGSGQGRLGYWQNEDVYADGVRYLSAGGSNGPWSPIDAEFGDLAFRVTLDIPTPAETRTFSSVKRLYR